MQHSDTITCQEVLSRLYEYIDGELEGIDREEVRRHLEMCRPCLSYFEFEQLFNEYVRERVPRTEARAEFKKQLFTRLQESKCDVPPPVDTSVPRFQVRFAVAAMLVLLLGVGAWWLAHHRIPGADDWSRLASYHRHTAAVNREGITTADIAEARAFVLSHLEGADRSFPRIPILPNLTSREVSVLPWKDGEIAQFEWRDGGDNFSLFIAPSHCLHVIKGPELIVADRSYHVATIDGLDVICWEDDTGYVCVIMGNADFGTMLARAEAVRAPTGS